MNRRTFFKLVGLGGAATVALNALPSMFEMPKTTAYSTYIMGQDAIFTSNKKMEPLTVADIRKCVEQLKAMDVKPLKDGQFIGWVHPDRAAEVEEWIRYKWDFKWTAGNSYSV
jgi:hypothetical protein